MRVKVLTAFVEVGVQTSKHASFVVELAEEAFSVEAMATPASAAPPQSQQQPMFISLESAGRLVDEHLQSDAGHLELSAQLKIATHSKTYREQTYGLICEVVARTPLRQS